jgi:hypothetical protein
MDVAQYECDKNRYIMHGIFDINSYLQDAEVNW